MKTFKRNVLRLGLGVLLLEFAIFALFYISDRKILNNIDIVGKENLGVVYITQLQKVRYCLYALHGDLQFNQIEGVDNQLPTRNAVSLIGDARGQLQQLSDIFHRSAGENIPFSNKLPGLIQDIDALLVSKDSDQQLQGIEGINNRIMQLIIYIADDQLLFFDPHRESYFLIILITQKLPGLIDDLVLARSQGVKLKKQQSLGLEDLSHFQYRVSSFQDGLKQTELFVGLLLKDAMKDDVHAIRKAFQSFNKANGKAVAQLDAFFSNPSDRHELTSYYHVLSDVIVVNQDFYLDLTFSLSKLLGERKRALEREMLMNNILFSVIIISVLTAAIYFVVDLKAKFRKRVEATTTQNFKSLLANQRSLQYVYQNALSFISEKMNAIKGVCYHFNAQNNKLYLSAAYAETEDELLKAVRLGEGLVGQVAKDCNINYQSPKAYNKRIDFGVANMNRNVLLTIPMMFEKRIVAVVQLLLVEKLSKKQMELLEILLAIAAHHIYNRFVEEENISIANLVDEYIITSKVNEKGVITSVSQAFIDISGYSREELLGKPYNILRHPDMPQSLYDDLWETIENGNSWRGEIKNRTKSGKFYWVDVIMSPDKDYYGNIIGYTAIRQDITDKKKIEELSIRDGMTGLYNRRYFDDMFGKIFKAAQIKQRTLYFGILDVDYFKQYNDTYGHQSGDNVLISIAEVLKSTLLRDDYGFRLGGEEFGILFYAKSANHARQLADTIQTNVGNLKIEHRKSSVSQFITLSIGLLAIPAGETLDEQGCYYKADQLLYRAKREGRNRIVFE